jgi:hypothetical protein
MSKPGAPPQEYDCLGNQALKAQFRRQKEVNRAFSADAFSCSMNPGAMPQARSEMRLWRSYVFPSTSADASRSSAA